MTNKLFIGNLSHGTTSAQLEEHFAKYGKVLQAKAILDKEGHCKGFGFVDMANEEEAQKALDHLNHSELDGKEIEVKEARPQE